ncbi:MAG TPA: hypothetical protein VFZ00_06560 [Solirubrobacter sp.]|nr:hypothetical protein [Solirubrobacter sp.]
MRPLALIGAAALLSGCGASSVGNLEPRRDAIPVLAYRGDVKTEVLERHLELLDDAEYDTIGLDKLIGHLRGERVSLPPRPFVLTFDGGRASTLDAEETLERHGYKATLFTDVGRVAAGDRRYLGWDELTGLRRFDVQLQSGTGNHVMRWGPGPGDVGSFYAYRGHEEVVGGWRERVFGDISWAERQLARRGFRPVAIAPPGGNYGQAGTNDPEIPRLLLQRLRLSFALVFTLDRPPLAVRGAGTMRPIGRLDMTAPGAERRLRELVREAPSSATDTVPR